MHADPGHRPINFDKPGFKPDESQLQAIASLEQLYQTLNNTPTYKKPLIHQLLKRKTRTVHGLYLWGGVGRGKTYLMDRFYDAIPFPEKQRVHFHRFMQEIHHELRTLPKSPDPLQIIAKRLTDRIRLLCLDEFHVQDIGDAMLLAGFFKTLFENGVTLVTTSNIPADELYKNGLQRERFLPAIELIKQHTTAMYLNGDTDYRSELLERTGTYHLSDTNGCSKQLQQQFNALVSDGNTDMAAKLRINHRDIETIAVGDNVAWFDFSAMCETPRSSADYLEIALRFQTIIISAVPQLSDAKDDVAQRFIHLIDALYDHNVKTIISAAAKPAEIYSGQRHIFAFQRAASRLQEMGSEAYLSKAHRPGY